MIIEILTVKAVDGRTPPSIVPWNTTLVIPSWNAMGCGRPSGGNIGSGGGNKAATANTPADAIAPSSNKVSTSSSAISMFSLLVSVLEHAQLIVAVTTGQLDVWTFVKQYLQVPDSVSYLLDESVCPVLYCVEIRPT